METKIGYKVFYEQEGKLLPLSYRSLGGKLFHYSLTKKNKPRRGWGPFCVFSILEAAQSFRMKGQSIYKVSYTPSPLTYIRGWNIYSRDWVQWPLNTCPVYTRLAKEVELLEKIV